MPLAGAKNVSLQSVLDSLPERPEIPELIREAFAEEADAVEAERRRAEQAGEVNPRRLSEAQRQELRDQIRRASLRTDNPSMSAVVSRP